MGLRDIPLSRPVVLATDLDGTFLGGTAQDRQTLYALIKANRSSLRLLFCTGRSYQNTVPLIKALGLPVPDAMICDVGCSVVHPDGTCPFPAIQHDIAAAWGQGHDIIAPLLSELEHLEAQTGVGPYRRSYFYSYEPTALRAKLLVESAGYDGLISDSKYFDVLPKNVNKGSTLRKVLHQMGVPASDVLTAGDTLNDLSMFESGLPSVVVGNAEPRLRAALPISEQVYHATRAGAGGILEALERRYA